MYVCVCVWVCVGVCVCALDAIRFFRVGFLLMPRNGKPRIPFPRLIIDNRSNYRFQGDEIRLERSHLLVLLLLCSGSSLAGYVGVFLGVTLPLEKYLRLNGGV